MLEYAKTERKTFPNHPFVRAVTALPERSPGETRTRLEDLPELGHLRRIAQDPHNPSVLTIPYLSPSQIKSWTRCGVAYYFQYRWRKNETENSKMFFGTATHIGSEVFFRLVRDAQIAGRSLDTDAFLAEAVRMAQAHAQHRLPQPMIWKPTYYKGPLETHASLVAGVGKAVQMMGRDIWSDLDPMFVERGYVIEWQNERVLPVLAYPDVVHKVGNEHAVMDNKTGAEKKELTVRLDVALAAYALANELFTGVRTRKVAYANYVRNKEPKLVLRQMELEDTQFERAFVRAAITTNALETGVFAPADDDQICSTCQFRDHCAAWLTLTHRETDAQIKNDTRWPTKSIAPTNPSPDLLPRPLVA